MSGLLDPTTERSPESSDVEAIASAIASGSERPKRGRPRNSENATRPEIARMSGHTSLDDLAAAIPGDTTTGAPADDKPKRGRKPKAEAPEVNPLMADKRYSEAVANMSSFGGAKTVKTAFHMTGKPLEDDEEKEVNDLFYVISKKYTLDPANSGIFLSIYSVLMLLRFIGVRFMGTTSNNMWEQFSGIFGGKKKEDEAE